MPDVRFPSIDFRALDVDKAAAELNKALREAAYVAVGLGVIGLQKAQVQRVELTRQLESQVDTAALRSQLSDLARSVDEAIIPIRGQLNEGLDRLEEALPATAREVVHTLRDAAASQEQAVRQAIGLS